MPKSINPQQTVAGRVDNGQVVYLCTRSSTEAKRLYNRIKVGYRSIDGHIVEQRGEVSEALAQSIIQACKLQQEFKRAKASFASKRDWLKRR